MKTKREPASEFTLAMNARPENNPMIIWPFPDANTSLMHWEETSYMHHPALADLSKEPLVRVFPKTGKDVAFIRMLEHRVDKFAPATGCGVLVKSRLICGS